MHPKLGNHVVFNTDSIAEQSLCIKDLGVELRQNKNYYFDNLARDYQGYLFQYTLDGYGIYEAKGNKHILTKGKAFFISFPEDSRYYFQQSLDASMPYWKFFYIHFTGPAVEPFYKRIRDIAGPVMDLGVENMLVSAFSNIYNTLQSKKQLDRYMGSEWLYRFLIAILKNVEFPSSRKASPHVTVAKEWIISNYSKPVNLEDMSPKIGVSYAHLTRLFYKEHGITPVQYLTQIRLEMGIQLLLNTNQSIKAIAEQCGFISANYFTKVFKKALHITPSEYRRQHKLS